MTNAYPNYRGGVVYENAHAYRTNSDIKHNNMEITCLLSEKKYDIGSSLKFV